MPRPEGAEEPRYAPSVPGTYSQLLYHIVFSTKHRAPLITDAIADRLHPYLGGLIRAERATPLEIGGVEDHVHLLIRGRTDDALANLMRTVKSRSSVRVHETWPKHSEFAWQEGYAAFTVSASQEVTVRRYIRNQREHHAKESFLSELERLLRAHGVEFDPAYALA